MQGTDTLGEGTTVCLYRVEEQQKEFEDTVRMYDIDGGSGGNLLASIGADLPPLRLSAATDGCVGVSDWVLIVCSGALGLTSQWIDVTCDAKIRNAIHRTYYATRT